MEEADNRTSRRKLGDIGENIACEFLKRREFEILDRNYLKKWGELDIVAKKGSVMRFVEVKSVKVSRARPLTPERSDGGRATSDYRPEDNMHPQKLRRLFRTIQFYLLGKRIDLDWQLDLVTVEIDSDKGQARVKIIENIVI